MGVPERVMSFIAKMSFDQIPKKAVEVAKYIILGEGLGTVLAGTLDPGGKAIVSFVKELGREGKAGVIGKGLRTSVPGAAMLAKRSFAVDHNILEKSASGFLTCMVRKESTCNV